MKASDKALTEASRAGVARKKQRRSPLATGPDNSEGLGARHRMRASRAILVSILTLGLLSSAPRLATAGAPQAFDFERRVSLLRCATGPADHQSSAALQRPFALELVVETKKQRIPTLRIARTTDELRRTLESPPPQPRHDAPVSIGRWRVIDSGGRNDGIFDQVSLALCKSGCALHKTQGVDTTQWIFVLAKPEERQLDVRWDLSEVDKYGMPYAVVAWVGYGGSYYVLHNPSDTMTPEKGSCSFQAN